MAAISSTILAVTGLDKRKLAQLAARAKDFGVTPEHYAKQLIEDGLEVGHIPRVLSFNEIMGPVRKATPPIDDDEIVRLVEKARRDYYRSRTKNKKR